MWLTSLADVIRRNTSLEVIEVAGWKTRGHGGLVDVQAIVCHHTAGRPTAANPYPSLGVVRGGRPGLDGPLSQLGLGGDCKVRVIAAGLSWHAGATFETWQNNWHTIGIEAEHPGGSAPWPGDMYAAYVELVAGLVRGYRPPRGVWGHKEIAKPKGRKPDPTFSMATFRAQVARAVAATGNQDTSPARDVLDMDEKRLREIIADELDKQDGQLWANKGGTGKQLVIDRLERIETDMTEVKRLLKGLRP